MYLYVFMKFSYLFHCIDKHYTEAFLLIYPTFVSHEELINKLVYRFVAVWCLYHTHVIDELQITVLLQGEQADHVDFLH